MPIKWRPVVGYEGHYEVSDEGGVRNVRSGRELRHHLVKGYHRVTLYQGAKLSRRNLMVHLLVAEAFVGQCPDGQQANHEDGNLDNNAASNLRYVTPSQNVRHSLDVLGVKRAQGEKHHAAKLTADLVRSLRAEYGRGGVTMQQLADRVGVNGASMRRALRGLTWRHI